MTFVGLLTNSRPYATAVLQGQIALIIQQFWSNFANRDSLDANILGCWIS